MQTHQQPCGSSRPNSVHLRQELCHDVFRDGNGMMLFVDPENPTKFVQKVSGKPPIFEMVRGEGSFIQLLADEDAVDGN